MLTYEMKDNTLIQMKKPIPIICTHTQEQIGVIQRVYKFRFQPVLEMLLGFSLFENVVAKDMSNKVMVQIRTRYKEKYDFVRKRWEMISTSNNRATPILISDHSVIKTNPRITLELPGKLEISRNLLNSKTYFKYNGEIISVTYPDKSPLSLNLFIDLEEDSILTIYEVACIYYSLKMSGVL
ncbi:tubby C-terminal domain-like protein [Paenibacillus turpanensis]|uniref:tubby C-terminal domain-like protein n=1 Tax=Paenibacillus turpanensis TaxID=2689078 RepID=UPI00140AFA38|nr:hypothetical protein [Paenibacillus turpanensis]